nr:pickpocket protein 28-like [Aedes albopictus]
MIYIKIKIRILFTQYHPRNELYWLQEAISPGAALVDIRICPVGVRLRNRLLAVLQICDDFFHYNENYPELYAETNHRVDVVGILRHLSVNVDHTILSCWINGRECNNLFTETLTEEGICFTFNGFSTYDMFRDGVLHNDYSYLNEPKNVTDWTVEAGYKPDENLSSHPIRALGSGFGAGLTMQLMAAEDNIEQHCREQQGFKVIVHPPSEYPQVTKKFALVTYSRDVTLAIHPVIMKTSAELRSYHPKRRHCYFNHERWLKFFRVYTQSNCELECVTNYTLKTCGCVKFSMPRSAGTRLCQTSEIGCVLQAEYKMLKHSAKRRLQKLQTYDTACDCIPECISIQYDAEITHSKCDFKKTLELRYGPINPPVREAIWKKQISKLAVYFKDVQFIASKRTELYGMTDFIANCGGILGLCLGVSLFSVVELLYYCLVHPMLMMKKSLGGKRKVAIVRECEGNRF